MKKERFYTAGFVALGIVFLSNILCILGCSGGGSSSMATTTTSTGTALSKLRVSGNRIVTEEGQEIRLRGVNFTDPFVLEKDDLDLSGDGLPDNHFKEIATDFARVKKLGANIVRLTLYPGYYRLVGGEKYLATYVDRMVDLAEENGLYAIISYHAIGRPGGWYESGDDATLWEYPAKVLYTDTDMAVAFWNKVAARYGKRKHALFEIYNEPADNPDDATDDLTWTDWRPTGELLIATIRKHSDNIVLGPGLNYTIDLSAVPTNPYSDSNLVYVAHVYPNNVPKGEDQVSEWERLFGFLAKTYPVIVSEWGFHDGGKDETTSGTLKGFGRPLLDYLDQKKIHWVAFLYHPPDAEPPMLETDWTTLTEFGKFVKERLQTSTPVFAAEIPTSLFGLHFFFSSNPWPTVSFSSYRLWDTGTTWALINIAEGEYDWTQLDILLDLARDHNVDLLYTFGFTPRWASLRPNEPCTDNPPGPLLGCAAPPRDMRYWDDFVRAVATHNREHGGRIKYWELWNEWDYTGYWTGDTATMVTMAQHAYQIIKSIDPNALVLTPDASDYDDKVLAENINRFLAAGGGNYADVIAFHGYRHTPEEINSLVNAIRAVMAANGQSAKPLWDTEGSWGQDLTLPDLDEQAAFVARYYLLHWSKGVERFYWYGWDSNYGMPDPQNAWGTLWDPRRGGIQKPGVAYREVYKWLVGATMTNNCAVQSDGTTWICGLSRPGGYGAQAIWNTAGNMSIQAPSQFRQYRDLDGNRVAIQSGGSVTIGIKPILLETETVVLGE